MDSDLFADWLEEGVAWVLPFMSCGSCLMIVSLRGGFMCV